MIKTYQSSNAADIRMAEERYVIAWPILMLSEHRRKAGA